MDIFRIELERTPEAARDTVRQALIKNLMAYGAQQLVRAPQQHSQAIGMLRPAEKTPPGIRHERSNIIRR